MYVIALPTCNVLLCTTWQFRRHNNSNLNHATMVSKISAIPVYLKPVTRQILLPIYKRPEIMPWFSNASNQCMQLNYAIHKIILCQDIRVSSHVFMCSCIELVS